MINAEINFAPICSNCGHIILEEVSITDGDSILYYDNHVACDTIYTIVPHNCPNCGCTFTRITMPCKLPYTYENLKLKKAVTLSCKGCSYDDGAFHSLCAVCTRLSSDGIDDYYNLELENQNEDT